MFKIPSETDIFGVNNENIAFFEKNLSIKIFQIGNQLTIRGEKKDINLLQDVYIPKSLDDFNNILNKFYNAEKGNKIDISKYLLVKK